MNAHVEAGSWSGVIRSFDYLASSPTRHLRLSIEVYNTLLKAYVLIGAPFAVISNLFVKLEEKTDTRPDMYSFALLIQSACDAGMMDTAVSIFAEMDKRSAGPEINMEITTFVFTIIMAGYLRQGDTVRAKEIYDNMCDRGIKPTAITFHMILKTYGNAGTEESVQLAESFVRTLMAPERSERYWDRPTDSRTPALEQIYRPVMIAYTRRDKPEDVVRLYQEMLDAGGDPSLGALTTLLDAYRRSDNILRVLEVWPQIVQLALDFSQTDIFFEGDNPISNRNTRRRANLLCVPLSIYINALSTAGLHQEIARAWKQLKMHGFTFDSHNWNHLSVALVRAGQPELAFEVVERVILPYQQRSDRMRMTRDRNPDTPLTFANQPDSGSFSEPHSEALRWEMERAQRVRKQSNQPIIGLDLKEMRSSDDLAHPLHILQQISPALYVWRPHEYTLRALSHVLMRLQSGLTINPMTPDVDPDQLEDTPERNIERSKHAREILGRIYKKYPKTLRHVLDFDILADRRLMEMEMNG
jgi:pentatricopeptide repeat-containing protein PET309